MRRLNKTIGFVGCGNMGSAILSGLLRNHIAQPKQIFVYDSARSKLESVSRKFRVNPTKSNVDLIHRAQIILLAVKPQDLSFVAREMRDVLRSGQTVISILAGMPIPKLKRSFGNHVVVVRAMPNLGAQVGEAVTALTGSNKSALRLAETIFLGCGKTIRLPEKYFDLVTAVSGSGPAYFFLMMELLAQVARRGGISEKSARTLAVQTALGAGKLSQASPYSPETLRKMVTSKKGTTEAALKMLERKEFGKIFHLGLHAAARRSRELRKTGQRMTENG